MSKYFLFFFLLCYPFTHSFSQYGYHRDVLKLSHTFQGGSARVLGIGGASVSLGGDVSSISQNPAGLGFVNRKLISLGYGILGNKSSSSYFGQMMSVENNANDIENISLVLPIKKKDNYLSSGIVKCPDCAKLNFGISYSRLKDFSDKKLYRGYNDYNSIIDYFLQDSQGIPLSRLASETKMADIALLQEAYDHYLINPDNELPGSYYSFIGGFPLQEEEINTSGDINKLSFSLGSNIRDKVFVGIGLNLYSVNYKQIRNFRESSFEVLDNTDQWVQEGILDYLNLLDVHSISGNGASISAGMIIKPSDNLNIGINYESKAGITLEEELYSELESKYFDYYFEPEDTILRNAISGTGSNFANYKYKSPSKITIGSSYFYKKFGFISADIDLIDYSSSRIQSYDFNDFMENKEIEKIYKALAVNYRFGLEGRYKNFYLRLGYNVLGDPSKNLNDSNFNNKINRKSFGIGYLSKTFSLDITYISLNKKSRVSPYSIYLNQPVADFDSKYNRLVISLGIRIDN